MMLSLRTRSTFHMDWLPGVLACLLLLLLTNRVQAVAQPVWDVAQQGRHASGDDITETLQRGLDTQHTHGLPVYVKAGWWKISKTVTLPFRSGVELRGEGMSAMQALRLENESVQNHPLRGKRTRLVWVGDLKGPILKVTGADVRLTGGLSLHGKPWGSDRPKCEVGMLITKDGKKGLATGHMQCEPLLVSHCKVGIQCGAKPEGHNCEALQFDWLVFRDCDTGYLGCNSQGMTTIVGMTYSYDTPRTFVYRGGGMLQVENSFNFGSTMLTIERNDPLKYTTSTGNGYFVFRNTKVDRQASGKFVAVDMKAATNVMIVFDGGANSGAERTPYTFARLQGSAALTVRDFVGVGTIEGKTAGDSRHRRTPNALVDRCEGGAKFKGQINGRLRDCFGYSGQWIEGSK